jgi:tetratricopeptide (TPR) repeat protein
MDPPAKTEEERRAARAEGDAARARFETAGDVSALSIALKAYERAGDRIEAARVAADLAQAWPERAKSYAQLGLKHAEIATSDDPASAAAHLMYAVNLGLVLKTEKLPSVDSVKEIARAAERSHELDPEVDRGQAANLLAQLYLKAPGWPLSIGDIDAADEWIARALAVAPDWPPHHLTLADIRKEQGRESDARRALERVLDLPVPAEHPIRGERWRSLARQRLAEIGESASR